MMPAPGIYAAKRPGGIRDELLYLEIKQVADGKLIRQKF